MVARVAEDGGKHNRVPHRTAVNSAKENPPEPPLGSVLWLVAGLLIVLYHLVPDGSNVGVEAGCLTGFYILVISRFRSPDRVARNIPAFITIENSFLILYYVIYFFPYQLDLIGRMDLQRSGYVAQTYVSEANQAMVAALLGAVVFLAAWARGASGRRSSSPGEHPSTVQYQSAEMYLAAGLASLIIVYTIAGYRSAGEGRYTGTSAGGALADGLSLGITTICCVAVALVIARFANRQRPSNPLILANAGVIFWAARILALGDRNSFLLIVVVAAAGAATFIFSVSRAMIIVMILSGFTFYNAVELARESNEGASIIGIWNALDGQETSRNEQGETSFNVSTIGFRAALAAIPEDIDFGWGRYKLVGAAGVVPFVRGTLLDPNDVNTSADALDRIMLPPDAGWSVGSNVLADAYADFGILGIPLVMGGLGWFAGRIRRMVSRDPLAPRTVIIYLVTLSVYAQLPRYSADFPVRVLLWTTMALWVSRALELHPRRQEGSANAG